MEKRIFFSGLNELRAIAALAVVFHHAELFKKRDGVLSLYDTFLSSLIGMAGANGVHLFFVLSGFLITYLLLAKLNETGSIHIRKFYARRVLRIYPLYYLLVFLCFFALPPLVLRSGFFEPTYYVTLIERLDQNFLRTLILFLLFLPNLALVLFQPVAGISQSWSVGVEEQFYLLWPIILKHCRNILLAVLIAIVVLKLPLMYALAYLSAALGNPYLDIMARFLNLFKVELMAIGGIGAYLLFRFRDAFYASSFPRRAYTVLLCCLCLIGTFLQTHYLLMGLLFILLILLCVHEKSNILNNKALASLGKVSYGIYMYHPLMIFFTFALMHKINAFELSQLWANVATYTLVLCATFSVSYLSYNFLELPFLKYKRKFSLVQSGEL